MLRFLPPIWETEREFQTPSFCMEQSRLMQVTGKETSRWKILFPLFILFKYIKITFLKNKKHTRAYWEETYSEQI